MENSTQLRYVIVPGLFGSGEEHWQTHWQRVLNAERVEQRDWSNPDLAVWGAEVVRTVTADAHPCILIAHSFGCLASVYALPQIAQQVHGILLVAPADPDKFSVRHLLTQTKLGVPSTLIASQTDPWLSFNNAAQLAQTWGSTLINLGDVGHMNPDSGFNSWEQGFTFLPPLSA